MSLKLFALNFASLATAQLTTSMWFPGMSNKTTALSGSVVAKNGDKVTVSLDYKDLTEDPVFYGAPATVTFAGTTLFAYQNVISDEITYTIDGLCTRKDGNAIPTCVASTLNYASLISDQCSSFTRTGAETQTVTRTWPADSDGPATTETITATFTNTETTQPPVCSESIDSDAGARTYTMGDEEEEASLLATYQLVLTAGTEKLSAAATPTAGGPGSTGGSNSPTGSAQSTGAAPMMTAAPILAGLGAAAAAIFL
jgi:hypothetical protein